LAKVNGTTATAAAVGFSDKLNEVPRTLHLSMTYDQGREMFKHAEITQKIGTAIYLADPLSPWQRGTNENTNGLLLQYLPKGTDLTVYSQEELDTIADSLNTRPCKTLDWRTPLDVFAEVLKKSVTGLITLQ
jgi:transposase, IS30 family